MSRPMCLSLTSPRSSVLLGEPLTLLVRLENCSKTPQRAYETLGPEYGSLAIWVRAPDAGEELYRPPIRRESRGAKPVELRPGEFISALVPVYFDAEGWNLSRPGRYQFRAELRSPTGTTVSSKPIPVSIVALDSKSMMAAEKLMSERAARFLYLQGGDSAGRKTLESVSREFSGSPWANYANLALAVDSATTSSNTLARNPEACRDIQSATSKIRDWALALGGYRAAVRCYRQVGDAKRATRVAEEAAQRYPQAQGIPDLRIE
jgi:hypothetical protein